MASDLSAAIRQGLRDFEGSFRDNVPALADLYALKPLRAIRHVLDLCDHWEATGDLPDGVMEEFRCAIAAELGVSEVRRPPSSLPAGFNELGEPCANPNCPGLKADSVSDTQLPTDTVSGGNPSPGGER